MKIINPATRWNKVKEHLLTDDMKTLKRRKALQYALNSARDCSESSGKHIRECFPHMRMRWLNTLKQNGYQLWYLCSHDGCLNNPPRSHSKGWKTHVWITGCHWAVSVYKRLAKIAYPEYNWHILEGYAHSTVIGFLPGNPNYKEIQNFDEIIEERVLDRMLKPDAVYDLIAYHFKLDPLTWVIDGIEKRILTN